LTSRSAASAASLPYAYRIGLATVARAPSGSRRSGTPLTLTAPSPTSRSCGATSSRSAARRSAFSRTLPAAMATALPAVTRARLANVPASQSDVAPVGASGALPRAEVAEADALERHLEPPRVVAAVVSRRTTVLEGQPDVPGKLVGLNEVAPANLARLEAELARDPADEALHDESAVRPPGAPVGRHHHLVRVANFELDVVVAKPVRSGELRRGDERDD